LCRRNFSRGIESRDSIWRSLLGYANEISCTLAADGICIPPICWPRIRQAGIVPSNSLIAGRGTGLRDYHGARCNRSSTNLDFTGRWRDRNTATHREYTGIDDDDICRGSDERANPDKHSDKGHEKLHGHIPGRR